MYVIRKSEDEPLYIGSDGRSWVSRSDAEEFSYEQAALITLRRGGLILLAS